MSSIVTLIAIIILICIYFAPSIIAYQYKHRNFEALLMLNIFLGWTLLGWVGALVWAHLKQDKRY